MRVIDPGHKFELNRLDGYGVEVVTYVKREGPGYPGNEGHYAGTNLQESTRAEIARVKYLDSQDPCDENKLIIANYRGNIVLLELRAARRHHLSVDVINELSTMYANLVNLADIPVEDEPTCAVCGHIRCIGRHNYES